MQQGSYNNDTINESNENEVPEDGIDKLSQNNLPGGQKVKFLIFEDGPSQEAAPLILDILNNYNLRAIEA